MLMESSGELTQSVDDDCLLDAPLLPSQKLEADIRRIFVPIPTVCASIFLLLLQVIFVGLSIASTCFCLLLGNAERCKQYTNPFELNTIMLMSKVLLWLLHVIYDRFVQYQHSKARNRGYLKLYRYIAYLKAVPLIVNSTGNAAVLLIISARDFYTVDHLDLYLIWSVLALELILSVVFLLMYTVHICRFNKNRADADVIEEEKTYAHHTHVNPGIGFREETSLEEVVEKQGDTIEYLKRHNEQLCRQLLAAMAHRTSEQTQNQPQTRPQSQRPSRPQFHRQSQRRSQRQSHPQPLVR